MFILIYWTRIFLTHFVTRPNDASYLSPDIMFTKSNDAEPGTVLYYNRRILKYSMRTKKLFKMYILSKIPKCIKSSQL